MTALYLRRSLTTLSTRLGTMSAQARRQSGRALYPGLSSSLGVNACERKSLWTSSWTTAIAPSSLRLNVGSVRWNSGKGDKPSLRQWGFEDINASLPADYPTSPSQKPQKNLILVDVREPIELTSTGIIPSAVAVPLASQPDALFLTPDEFETRFGFPKPGAEKAGGDVVFYCKAGVRARTAAQLAVQAGYDPDRVGVYDGSWLDWADKGGKVEKWEGDDYD